MLHILADNHAPDDVKLTGFVLTKDLLLACRSRDVVSHHIMLCRLDNLT